MSTSPELKSKTVTSLNSFDISVPLLDWQTYRLPLPDGGHKVFAIAADIDGRSFWVRRGIAGNAHEVKGPFLFKPSGKDGTSTFISAEERCADETRRLIGQQSELGYRRFDKGILFPPVEIDLFSALPRYVSTCKPKDWVDPKVFKSLLESDNALIFRKYDGNRVIVSSTRDGWHITSSGGHSLTDRCGPQIRELERSGWPLGSHFLAELTIFKKDNPYQEDFHALNRWADPKRNAARVRERIERGFVPEPTLVILDVFAFNGKALCDMPKRDRWNMWRHLPLAGKATSILTGAEPIGNVTPENYLARAEELKVEGFMLYDANGTFGRKVFSYNKEEHRTSGIHKLKLRKSEDVVIIAAREEDGKLMSVYMKQRYPSIDPHTGLRHPKALQWFYCGGMQIGNRPDIRKHLLKYIPRRVFLITNRDQKKDLPKLIHRKNLGVAVEIQYNDRDSKGMHAFRHPVFLEKLRSFRNKGGNAKSIAKCVAQYFGSGILESATTGRKDKSIIPQPDCDKRNGAAPQF